MRYSMVNIRTLKLFKPELISDGLYSQEEHDDFPEDKYFHFPMLLKPDHSLWKHGSLYLLSKLEAFKRPSPATLSSQANDLTVFMNYMEEQQLDYVVMPKRKAVRPTYQFRFHLQNLIKNGEITDKTARRRMNAVISFYRWLSKQHGVDLQYDPWIESTAAIDYETHFGLQRTKLVKTFQNQIPSGITSSPSPQRTSRTIVFAST